VPLALGVTAALGLAVPAALVIAAPAAARTLHLGDRVLTAGMSGHDVRVLQDYLSRAGFSTPVVGVFGPVTDHNVRSFQRRYHLAATGVVDVPLVKELRLIVAQKSHTALASSGILSPGSGGTSSAGSGRSGSSAAPLFHRVLREGMQGNDVKVLQDYLTRAGYPTSADGAFGPMTAQCVKSFENDHGLPSDGVVSAKVAVALQAAARSTQTLSTGPPAAEATIGSNGLAIAPASAPGAIKAVIAAGNRIALKPYIYGGGHGSWNDSGYDCSGSVSFALHGANLISAPEDSGELESYGSPGPGRWITLWSNAGHVYMYVAGLRFDTSAQGETGGSRWTPQARSNDGFVERHPTGL
jgi:peptidoglycan hydrolase-like protein with peptidoglycan-binding domain